MNEINANYGIYKLVTFLMSSLSLAILTACSNVILTCVHALIIGMYMYIHVANYYDNGRSCSITVTVNQSPYGLVKKTMIVPLLFHEVYL